MANPLRVWVIVNQLGLPLSWGISSSRSETMMAAANGFLGANEFLQLGTDSKRWAKCYRMGIRVRRAVVTFDDVELGHD